MLKVLGISGSPRRGSNTEIVVNEALQAIASNGIRVELLSVAGRRILSSVGDNRQDLSVDDDAHEFIERMLEANGIVVGSPVYFRNVSGQLKNLMDRTHFLHASYKLGGKVGGAIAVTGSTGAESTLAIINSFFLQELGKEINGRRIAPNELGSKLANTFGIGSEKVLAKS